MMKIFMSYSSKNRPVVATLAQDLQAQGYQVWFDREVPGGQSWWDTILGQIRACDLFLFALTPLSLDSKPCKLEYGYANDLGKIILPVLLEDGVSVNLLPPPCDELTTSEPRWSATRVRPPGTMWTLSPLRM